MVNIVKQSTKLWLEDKSIMTSLNSAWTENSCYFLNACYCKGFIVRVPKQKTLLTKKNTKGSSHICQKNWDYPKNILWTDETKVELFGRRLSRYIWRKPTQHFIKKIIMPTVKQGGGSVMVWGWLAIIDWTMNSAQSENPEGEYPAVRLWPQAQVHLGYAAGHRFQTHQQVHLWMAQEKQNEGFGVAKSKSGLESDWGAVAWP